MKTTNDTLVAAPGRARPFSAEAAALLERFPPRQIPGRWEGAEGDRVKVLGRLLAPPFCLDNAASQYDRRAGLIRVLDWLGSQPGSTWQDRWCASGAGLDGSADWRNPALQWLKNTGRISGRNKTVIDVLGPGLLQLICGDVIRPGIAWLLTSATPQSLAAEMARVRDVDGFAAIGIVNKTSAAGQSTTRTALHLADSTGRRNTFMWRWANGATAGMGSCPGGAAGDAVAGAASGGQARTPAAVLGGDRQGNAE
jgi:hypothetical protein